MVNYYVPIKTSNINNNNKEKNNKNKENYCYTIHMVLHTIIHIEAEYVEIMFQKHDFTIITKIVCSKHNLNCMFHTYNSQLLLF